MACLQGRKYTRSRLGWAAISALLLLNSCSEAGPDGPYATYLSRLGRTLSVPVPTVDLKPPPLPPRSGQLQLEISSDSLDALDFLALRGCALQLTIGKRNSSLGRLAKPSQRLLLELEYLRLAPECIARLRQLGRGSLAEVLQQAWDVKRRQLPALIFNATLGSTEYRALWRNQYSQENYPANTGSDLISSLNAINSHTRHWLAGDYRADNHSFELLLSEVLKGDGGALLRALTHQYSWLRGADHILTQRLDRGPLCTPGYRPAAADILPKVVQKYFVGGTQSRSAALGRRYYDLLPALRALELQLAGALPREYLDWLQARDSILEEAMAAPRLHVQRLIHIQRPCEKPA